LELELELELELMLGRRWVEKASEVRWEGGDVAIWKRGNEGDTRNQKGIRRREQWEKK
jgi:hypothetical protein